MWPAWAVQEARRAQRWCPDMSTERRAVAKSLPPRRRNKRVYSHRIFIKCTVPKDTHPMLKGWWNRIIFHFCLQLTRILHKEKKCHMWFCHWIYWSLVSLKWGWGETSWTWTSPCHSWVVQNHSTISALVEFRALDEIFVCARVFSMRDHSRLYEGSQWTFIMHSEGL